MTDHNRTKEELVSELLRLRRRVAALETTVRKAPDGPISTGALETVAADNVALEVDAEAFRRMFQDHGAVMYIVDLSTFTVIDANKAALNFYGYDLETMLTKRVPDLNISPEEEIRAEIKRAVRDGRSHYAFKHRLANGEIRDVEIYANPISIQGRQYSFSVVHDVTVRKRVEEHYRLLLEAIPDPVVVYAPQHEVTYINEAFEKTYGWTKDELIGGTIDFVPSGEVERTQEVWQRTLAGESIFFETKRTTKNGRLLDIQLKTAVLKDENGNHYASIVIHRDVTVLKKAEDEREKLITELQQALVEVKTLSGFLPICAACKKIRDDRGYWNQIESYIRDHSEAQFSHSICPECAKELYHGFGRHD